MRISTAQLPKPPHGADRIVLTGNAVVVLDGASAIQPVSVPPDVYADHLGASIAAALTARPEAALASILVEAIGTAASSLGLTGDDCPSSTVAMARSADGLVDLLVLGDSFIFYDTGSGAAVLTDDRLAELCLPEQRQYRERLQSGGGYDDTHWATLRRLQREQRKRRNRRAGYWIAEKDPAAAGHARTLTLPVSATAWVVLATDGAVDTAQHLGLADWPAIAHYDQAALTRLLQRCHDWEEHTDPGGQRFPRAKRHDDKTIASVRIARP
ncbi:MAG: hypothetical protein ABSA53_30565 [Streptosporangiaceae bacterium]|jgi:hypothetical protein